MVRSIELENFIAARLKVNFFVLDRLISITGRVNSVGTLRFRSGKESFGFKKLLKFA